MIMILMQQIIKAMIIRTMNNLRKRYYNKNDNDDEYDNILIIQW